MGKKSFISIGETYFNRFQSAESSIDISPNEKLKLSVVIPSFNEPDLIDSIHSLLSCEIPEDCAVELIVVVNHPSNAPSSVINLSKQNLRDVKLLQSKENLSIHVIYAADMDPKYAGVGWARKIGMDESLKRFMEVNYDGVICCFDADTLASKDYFTAIYSKFNSSSFNGASVYFEHPLSGNNFSNAEYQGIALYETHLRYYKNCLSFCGFPYAFHTVGSSMVVKASAYAKQGGMNKRKAGEDFYFINKIIALGNYTEINTTTVIPSPRISDRVPFGTGRAILDAINCSKDLSITYDFSIFCVIKQWVENILIKKELSYSFFHPFMQSFIDEKHWNLKIKNVISNTSSPKTFTNRFFQVFDPFWMLKCIHHIKEYHVPDSDLLINSNHLLNQMGYQKSLSILEALESFRNIDKKIGDLGPL